MPCLFSARLRSMKLEIEIHSHISYMISKSNWPRMITDPSLSHSILTVPSLGCGPWGLTLLDNVERRGCAAWYLAQAILQWGMWLSIIIHSRLLFLYPCFGPMLPRGVQIGLSNFFACSRARHYCGGIVPPWLDVSKWTGYVSASLPVGG
jgi:hypothetical protein